MKRTGKILLCAAMACTIYSCAVERDATPNEDAIYEFESWRTTYFPDAESTSLGVYILKENITDTDGSAASADDAGYIKVNYVVRDLKGQISSSNTEAMAKQLGNYTSEESAVNYYGPAVWNLTNNSLTVGIKEMLKGMKEGDSRTGAIPAWLATTTNYSTEQEYRDNVTGGSHYIYEISIEEVIKAADGTGDDGKKIHKDDLDAWQIEQMEDFIGRSAGGYGHPAPGFEDWEFPGSILDTLKTDSNVKTYMGSVYGFYFDNGAPVEKDDSVAFSNTDTTLMINYTGRRLLPKYDENGKRIEGEYDEQIFDTTIENLAKDAGIFKTGKTYGPVSVKWSDQASGITLGGSSVIPGFYTALWNMQYKHKKWDSDNEAVKKENYRKAIAIFYSAYGYGTNGSGNMIPGYAPLMFEIEIIKEEED